VWWAAERKKNHSGSRFEQGRGGQECGGQQRGRETPPAHVLSEGGVSWWWLVAQEWAGKVLNKLD
jgi:hypothetical protein